MNDFRTRLLTLATKADAIARIAEADAPFSAAQGASELAAELRALARDFRPIGQIERDEDMDRTYIPLPGGWEVQTKGKGSTFRLCDPSGERLPIPDSPYLHEWLERMAREIHAASVVQEAVQ